MSATLALLAPLLIAAGGQTPVLQVAGGTLELGNSAAQLGGRLASQGSAALTAVAQQLAAAKSSLKGSALKGTVDIFKQAIDIGGNLTARIPMVGAAVGLGNGALKTGADVLNSLGQNAINASQALAKAKMGVINGVVQAGSGAFMSLANASAAAASVGLQGAVGAVGAALSGSTAALGGPTTTRPIVFNYNVDLFF